MSAAGGDWPDKPQVILEVWLISGFLSSFVVRRVFGNGKRQMEAPPHQPRAKLSQGEQVRVLTRN